MRSIFLYITCLSAMVLFFNGCKDPCEDVVCENGLCGDGICVCQASYTGQNCEIAFNEKYVGTYAVNDVCTPGGTTNYQVVVAPVVNTSDMVELTGLYNQSNLSVEFHIGGAGEEMHMMSNSFQLNGLTFIVNGMPNGCFANADASQINLEYEIVDASQQRVDLCTAVLTRVQ